MLKSYTGGFYWTFVLYSTFAALVMNRKGTDKQNQEIDGEDGEPQEFSKTRKLNGDSSIPL